MGAVTPPEFPNYEPGLAARFMAILGHEYECEMPPVLTNGLHGWPARHPLVTAIPMAIIKVDYERQAEAQTLGAMAASFCGGLTLEHVMESDQWLR